MKTQEQLTIRNMNKGFYDTQKLRVASGNRLVAQFLNKMGKAPGEKLEDAEKNLLALISVDYKNITEYIVQNGVQVKTALKRMPNAGTGVISTASEYELVKSWKLLDESENLLERQIKMLVEAHPLWDYFLKDIKGCGPLMASVIISEFDVEEARHVSSFWKYAGLDVVLLDDGNGGIIGEGRGKKAAHLEEYEYTDREGALQRKKGITYNPFLKTKLLGVLGSSFLKVGKGEKYEQIYRGYRHRLDNMPAHASKSDGHKHNMAIRYMVKMFVQDLWVAWRTMEGLPVSLPYAQAKLGLPPHGAPNNGVDLSATETEM